MIEDREYNRNQVISFFKTDEDFGILSNMKGKQRILINDFWYSSSEAIYQSLKFPLNKEIQQRIALEKSPILAKRIAAHNLQYIRKDWHIVKNNVMRLSIRIRSLQSQEFYDLLLNTNNKQIVEISRKDRYWGTTINENNTLSGKNVLGRLLMELREEIVAGAIFNSISSIVLKVQDLYVNENKLTIENIINDAKKNHITTDST